MKKEVAEGLGNGKQEGESPKVRVRVKNKPFSTDDFKRESSPLLRDLASSGRSTVESEPTTVNGAVSRGITIPEATPKAERASLAE